MANRSFKRTHRYAVKVTLRRMIRTKQVTYAEARNLLHYWVQYAAVHFPRVGDPWHSGLDFEGMIIDIMAAKDRVSEASDGN